MYNIPCPLLLGNFESGMSYSLVGFSRATSKPNNPRLNHGKFYIVLKQCTFGDSHVKIQGEENRQQPYDNHTQTSMRRMGYHERRSCRIQNHSKHGKSQEKIKKVLIW